MTARYGDQVQLKSPQGVEYKRNVQHVKRFVTPVIEPEEPVLIPHQQTSGQESTPSPKVGGSASPVVDCSRTRPQPGITKEIRESHPIPRETLWLCHHLMVLVTVTLILLY